MQKSMSTHFRSTYETTNITIDSKDAFTSTIGDEECSFVCKLSEPINLTETTEVYLNSIHIGGYKINENINARFDDDNSKDMIRYFSVDIPEFQIRQSAGQYNSDGKVHSTEMHHRFNIALETNNVSKIEGVLQPIDYRPFVLGHLGKTSVFVSEIKACTITQLHVNIRDQDGNSIFKSLVGDGHAVDANPPSKSRRIIMQFLLITQ
uniref:Uncharacterized protein n=1 Tax=viral metagenome TaxID=1070528 RepID=A0A6C0KEF8_9ZZZZ